MGERIAGIDIARGLAIVGMFAAHTITRDLDGDTLVDGRSAILFATLAGVSLGLMTSGPLPADVPRGRARAGIAIRGGLLFALGTLLWLPRTDIAVILDYYGLMFLLILPALFAPRWLLAGLAATAAVAGPLLTDALGSQRIDSPFLEYVLDRLVTGYYPALSWVAFLALGLICARSGLTRLRTQLGMLVGGGVGMLLGYGAADVFAGVTAAAHSNTTAEIVGSGGFAVALIGALLLLTDRRTGMPGRIVRTVAWPIGAAGSMPLTIYTAQLVALAIYIWLQPEPFGIVYPWPLFAALAFASLAFASLWRWRLGPGPLERLMRTASGWPWRDPDAGASRSPAAPARLDR